MASSVHELGLRVRLPRLLVRRDGPLGGYESALARAGFENVAGADEAGRGACAGPLVVAACVLPAGRRGRIDGLDDSKVLTAATRERLYRQVVARAVAYTIVLVSAAEIDSYGLHVANLAGMRRALCTLSPSADYALTDGFPVRGLGMPSTAVWKGDATVACIAAASILAKVTRDAIMSRMHDEWPHYEFAQHKGYITPVHSAALAQFGPCPQHRRRYVNVRRALGALHPVDMLGDNEVTGSIEPGVEVMRMSMSDACGAMEVSRGRAPERSEGAGMSDACGAMEVSRGRAPERSEGARMSGACGAMEVSRGRAPERSEGARMSGVGQ